jgi:hypothetical protein
MADKKKIGQLILLVVVLAVAYFGYRAFTGGGNVASNINPAGGPESATQAGQEILAQLNNLKKINLSNHLFTGPAYLSLKDFTVTLNDQPKGRPNPFAPIGQDNQSKFQALNASSTSNAMVSTTGTTTAPSTSTVAGSQTSLSPVAPSGSQTQSSSSTASKSNASAQVSNQQSSTPPPPTP